MHLVIVDRAAYRAPHALDLRQICGLTILKAANATALAYGRDVEEIAAMRRVGPGTRYEEKALRFGRRPAYLTFLRK